MKKNSTKTYLNQTRTFFVALDSIELLGCRDFPRQIFIFHAVEKVSKNKQRKVGRSTNTNIAQI